MKMLLLLLSKLKLVMSKLLLLMHLSFHLKNKLKFRHRPKLKSLQNNKQLLVLNLKLPLR